MHWFGMHLLHIIRRKYQIRLVVLLAGMLLATGVAMAQEPTYPRRGSVVVDDTTKQIYGPTTSRYFQEQDVFLDREKRNPIDTVIRNFHRFTFVERYGYTFQDLGNIGTAIRPIFYQPPTSIGARSGFDVYDLYWLSDAPRYFDTKSPYTNLNLGLGGKGRSITNVTFARNINPRWNFGFDFRGLFTDKQVQRQAKGDRNVIRNYYDVFTTYESKDSTYRLFFNFRRASHEVYEYGGIQLTPQDSSYRAYFEENALPRLTAAKSLDFRNGLHLYQQYRLATGLELYHEISTSYQRARFQDDPSLAPAGYYDRVEVDSATTRDMTKFATLNNEAGIKGKLAKLYYNAYARIRSYRMDYQYLDEGKLDLMTRGDEIYFGGRIALYLDTLLTVGGHLEYLPDDKYLIEGTLNSPWLEASASRSVYRPSFFHQIYRGSHDYWYNHFRNTEAISLQGRIKADVRHFFLHPGLTFNVLRNYIFMKEGDYNDDLIFALGQTVIPQQTDGYQTQFSPELTFGVTFFRHVSFENRIIYTRMLENAGDALQLPELFVNSQLSYANIFFDGNLDMQLGIEMHWNSAYHLLAYDVATQHFYVQQQIETPSFPLVTAFFNFKIRKARLFVRYHNPVQFFMPEGYMPTPLYPGQRNIIDFGFDWSFYD